MRTVSLHFTKVTIYIRVHLEQKYHFMKFLFSMFCVKLISSLQSQNTAKDLKNKLVNENTTTDSMTCMKVYKQLSHYNVFLLALNYAY